MHSALPLFEWRTPPGRAALREELRRCDAALRAFPADAPPLLDGLLRRLYAAALGDGDACGGSERVAAHAGALLYRVLLGDPPAFLRLAAAAFLLLALAVEGDEFGFEGFESGSGFLLACAGAGLLALEVLLAAFGLAQFAVERAELATEGG
jgi:hypothetical protein